MLRNKSDCCSNREGSDVFFDSSGEALTILYTFTTPLSSPDKTTEDSFPKYNSARYLVDQMLLLPEKRISGQLYYSVLRIFAESCNTKFAFQGLTIWEQLKKKNPEFGHFLIAMELLVVQKKFFELQKVYQEAIEKFKNTVPLERRFLYCSLKILRNYLQEKDLENSRLIFNQLIKLNCKIPPDIYFSIIMIHADTAGVHSFYNGTKLWLQIKDYEKNSKNLPFMAVMELYGKHGDLYNLEKLFQSLSSNANVSKYCIKTNYMVGLMDAKEPEKVKNAYYSYFKSFLGLKEEKALLRLCDRLLEIAFDTKDLEWAKHIFMNIKNSESIPNMSIYERYIKNMCLLGQKEHAKQVLEEILSRDWRSEGLDIERLEKYIYRV